MCTISGIHKNVISGEKNLHPFSSTTILCLAKKSLVFFCKIIILLLAASFMCIAFVIKISLTHIEKVHHQKSKGSFLFLKELRRLHTDN